jgi:hypothetical protein
MEEELYVSDTEIAEYIWDKLLAKGYVPESDEVLDLAEITFDFLIDKGVIGEVIDFEGEE